MVLVRPAVPSDAAAVREAHVAAVWEFGPAAYDDEQVAAWADRDDGEAELDRLDDPGLYVVVAERPEAAEAADDRGPVVGFARLAVVDSEVTAVYVHPDHAGRGVGGALLAHVEGYARAVDCEALTLWSSLNAVGFYERAGYERLRETTHETTVGVELPCVVMEKRL